MFDYKVAKDDVDWEQLFDLYSIVGLVSGLGKKRDVDKIKTAFINSFKVVTAWQGDKLVGAGRMISDGICRGLILDLGVLPEYQKQGVGKGIMVELLKGSESFNLHLTSTFGNEEFYKKLGFKKHKTAFAKYPSESEYLED